jgi:hypothetical protein
MELSGDQKENIILFSKGAKRHPFFDDVVKNS